MRRTTKEKWSYVCNIRGAACPAMGIALEEVIESDLTAKKPIFLVDKEFLQINKKYASCAYLVKEYVQIE